MYVKAQSFLVLGISKSGYSAAKYILEKGGECYIYEQLKSEKINVAMSKLLSLGAKVMTKDTEEEILNEIDVLVVSPGVPINHEIAVKCKELGKRIMGEVEFSYENLFPQIIAVTGTNGKTTTVTLIESILKNAKEKCELVGNVGVPISERLKDITTETTVIAEISSFQLESMSEFKPHIACVLNVTPDHLERHYTMENYLFLKRRILTNLKESEYAVLNFDDQTVKQFADSTRAEVVWVSTRERVNGAYAINGGIYFYEEYVCSTDEIALHGEHNLYNALFSVAVAKLNGISNEIIRQSLSEFKGVPHRVQLVAEINNVKYYNDSKSTNTASTIMAISTMTSPTVLILGGSEKGESYEQLFTVIKTSVVKHTVITGASKFNMFECAHKTGVFDVTVTSDFNTAVKIAKMFASPKDAVLLSPACASFDAFSDFEERGNAFVKAVNEDDEKFPLR